MIPYYFLLGIPIFQSVCLSKASNKPLHKKQFTVAVTFFILLFLLMSLRHRTVGDDVVNYINLFYNIARTNWNALFVKFDDIEPGYVVLNKLISYISTDEQFFLIATTVIILLPISIFYSKKSENTVVSMAIFMILPTYAMMFSGIRQAIAISLALPAFECIKNKKFIRFFLCVLLAYTFHASAFVMLLLLPIYYLKLSRNSLLITVPVVGIVYLFNEPIFKYLISLMGEEYAEHYGGITRTSSVMMLILFILMAALAYVAIEENQLDRETLALRNILVLSVVLQTFVPINLLVMRMNYYFIIFIPILIPRILNRCAEKNKMLYTFVVYGMTAFFIVYFFVNAYSGEAGLKLYPHKFFWEG